MSVRTAIKQLGGLRCLAADLGHAHHTTVQGWWERDSIPARHIGSILIAARAKGVNLRAEDLLPNSTEPLA